MKYNDQTVINVLYNHNWPNSVAIVFARDKYSNRINTYIGSIGEHGEEQDIKRVMDCGLKIDQGFMVGMFSGVDQNE